MTVATRRGLSAAPPAPLPHKQQRLPVTAKRGSRTSKKNQTLGNTSRSREELLVRRSSPLGLQKHPSGSPSRSGGGDNTTTSGRTTTSNDSPSEIIPLHVGDWLGRTVVVDKENRLPASSSSLHHHTDHNGVSVVPLGLTKVTAPTVSRHACVVRHVSRTSLTIEIPPHKPCWLYYRRQRQQQQQQQQHHGDGSSSSNPPETTRHRVETWSLTLSVGDSLIFRDKIANGPIQWHEFVVTSTTTGFTTTTANSKQKQKPTQKKNGGSKKEILPVLGEGESYTSPLTGRSYLPSTEWSYDLYNMTTVLSVSTPSKGCTAPPTPLITVVPPLGVQEPPAPIMVADPVRGGPPTSDDPSDSEEEDSLSGVDHSPSHTLHVTLANTYGTALVESHTPSVGGSLLHLALRSGSNNNNNSKRRCPILPTSTLAYNVMNLLTWGAMIKGKRRTNDDKTKIQKTNAQPYWDPSRLVWAQDYVDTLFQYYPRHAFIVLGNAVEEHYWNSVLEQVLSTSQLAYGQDTTEALQTSLQLQTYSLQLLLRFLQHGFQSSSSSSLPPHPPPRILQDVIDSDLDTVCRLAAKALAHVVCTYGLHLMEEDSSSSSISSSSSSSSLPGVVIELIQVLGSINRILLQRKTTTTTTTSPMFLSPNKQNTLQASVDILWNALDCQWQEQLTSHHHHNNKTTKNKRTTKQKDGDHTILLKLYWIESLGDEPLEQALAQRLRLTNEYQI